MATGKFGSDLDAIAYGSIAPATDLLTICDVNGDDLGTGPEDKKIAVVEFTKRSLGGSDISWMTALANLAAVTAADDKLLVWDASATAWKPLAISELLNRTFAGVSIADIATLANVAAIAPAADKLAVWDASATAWKLVPLSEIIPVLQAGANFYNIVTYGADPTGVADSASAINAAHAAAAAATPKGIVIAPVGEYKVASTVTLQASMIGMGGAGYSSSFGRAVFVPTMTDGSPCLKGVGLGGVHFARFSIDTSLATSAARNCIGLQLGQCAALIVNATKANPGVITTKYPHTFQTGDSVIIDNVLGMTNLNGNTYTVTRISELAFSIGVNSTAYSTYTSGGLVYPADLGVANKVSRGVIEDVSVTGVHVGFHLQGWINKHAGLKAFNCTLGFDGSYLNASLLDYAAENCGQALQLLGTNKAHLVRLEDEVGTASSGAKASTIDYCENIHCSMWATEGTRSVDTPWLAIGGVSGCIDIDIPHGYFAATPSVAKSVTVGNVTRYTLPKRIISGFSTTSSSEPQTTYTPTWAASGTAPAIGDGTLSGSYHWEGSACTVNIAFAAGSTTTFGTGSYTFSLPFTSKRKAIGAVKILDNGTAHYVGVAVVSAGGSTVVVYAGSDAIGQTAPFTWANGDTMDLTITYAV